MKSMGNNNVYEGVRGLNFLCAVVHICLLVLIAYRMNKEPTKELKITVKEHLPREDDESLCVFEGSTTMILVLLAILTAVTFTFHCFYASNNTGYINALNAHNNYYRWIEYSVTATIMIVTIALLSGVQDYGSLMLIAVCTIGCMMCNNLVEKSMKFVTKERGSEGNSIMVLCMTIGYVLLIPAWCVVVRGFKRATETCEPDLDKNGEIDTNEGAAVPGFVKCAFAITIFFFIGLGIAQAAQAHHHLNGKTVIASRKMEKTYIVLSLLSRAALVTVLLVGTIS